jgi:hypothetical protein
MAEPSRYPGTPRWVKVFGLVVGVLALLFVVAHLTGHGMGHHGDSGNQPAGR